MDAYQQPPPSYVRPPPAVDPYHHYYQNPARPPAPPPQQVGPSWHTNQFQYSHSPSPPPPPQSHWGPPPPEHLPQSNPFGTYSPAPPPPYAAHLQFPLPARPAMPPSVYPPANQEWGNTNWGYNQGQGYQAQTNTEDWAAKAREWAAAKAATENQHPQSQLTPENRPGEHSGFSEQYLQSAGTHYQENSHRQDIQQHSVSPSSYQQFPDASAPPQDGNIPYHVGDRRFPGVSTAGFPHQASLSTSSTIHQQEVPSSYSSVPGTEDAEHKESYKSPPMLMSVGQTGQHEEQYAYGNHASDSNGNHSHHPLHFTPRVGPGPDFHLQSSYASVPNAWAPPVATGVGYLPIPSLHSAPQHDSSIAAPSVSGHAASSFGRFPPTNFQPTIPSAGTSYNIRPPLHPTAAFLDDSYGASAVSERAKKASVPNWLREEILKNKAALGKSLLEKPEEEAKATDDEVVHKNVLDADQADNKSFDSSKSIEDEEEEDEDYVEAARTAAINQEIKRILTEVLLKVTDKLFDEIASKVVNEGATPEDELEGVQRNQASPKILVPHQTNGSNPQGVDRNSRFQSSGVLLGLANYASDDEDEDDYEDEDKEDNKVKNGSLKSSSNSVVQESTVEKIPEGDASENGKLNLEPGGKTSLERDKDCDLTKTSVPETKDDKSGENALAPVSRIMDDKTDGDSTEAVKTLEGKAEIPVKSANLSTNFQQETERGSGKHLGQELVKNTIRVDDKLDEDLRKLDGSRHGKDKTVFRNGPNDRTKVQDFKPADMIKEHESRKTSTRGDVKDDKKDSDRHAKAGSTSKDGTDRKRERENHEKRARHKHASESSREKRRRSSLTSEDSSDDSRRKSYPRRRDLSPSPVRGRRRQVSRSPHSKHSQHRHSSYSTLEKTPRGRRSRSRSPRHRRHR